MPTDKDSPDKSTDAAAKKAKRGFAAMSIEKQKEIASKGGQAAHEKGVAHTWDKDQAKAAGRKGGLASAQKKSDSKDRKEIL